MQQTKAWRAKSGSRRVFTELFSFPRYIERLGGVAAGLLGGEATCRVTVPGAALDRREPAASTPLNGALSGVALH
jgi:hypothetical protein